MHRQQISSIASYGPSLEFINTTTTKVAIAGNTVIIPTTIGQSSIITSVHHHYRHHSTPTVPSTMHHPSVIGQRSSIAIAQYRSASTSSSSTMSDGWYKIDEWGVLYNVWELCIMCGSVIRVWGVVFCKRCRSFVDCVGILYNVWELCVMTSTF